MISDKNDFKIVFQSWLILSDPKGQANFNPEVIFLTNLAKAKHTSSRLCVFYQEEFFFYVMIAMVTRVLQGIGFFKHYTNKIPLVIWVRHTQGSSIYILIESSIWEFTHSHISENIEGVYLDPRITDFLWHTRIIVEYGQRIARFPYFEI